MATKIAIVGSRDFKHTVLVQQLVLKLVIEYGSDLVIVSGGAKGVDSIAEEEAKRLNVKTEIYKVDMSDKPENFDNRVWFAIKAKMRNSLIVQNSDKVYAFWNQTSKGTKHTINEAHRLKKPIEVIYE